jgi:hypothetical protein
MNLRRMQRQWQPLFDWDFTQQSAGALVLPTGLSFARASSGHSVQTGTNALLVGGAIASNDVARIGRLLDAHSYGILIEPARTNLLLNNRDQSAAGWAAGFQNTQTYNAAAGPDGSVVATRNATLSGGYSRYQVLSLTVGQTYAASAWIRAESGTSEYRVGLIKDSGSWTYAGGPGQTVDTSWARKSLVRVIPTGGATNVFFSFDGVARVTPSSVAAQAADLYSDMGQVELGKYPTSAIITTGSTATRAAERLTIDSTRATQATVNGRLGFYVRFRAIAALTEMDGSTEGEILFGVGSTCYVWISPTSRYILLGDGGSKYSQTANSVISWARGDLVEMAMELGNGVSAFRWRINGSVNTASFTARNDSLDPIVPSSGIDVLCAGTNWHTPAVLEQATLFVPGRAPF